MARLLILVACLFIFGCASSPKHSFVRVAGSGSTENEALQSAFTKAVEQETGVLLLSERESRNNSLIKNELLGYSSGYVDDFKIVSVSITGNTVYVLVDVLVSESKIKNRILGQSKSSNNFDGQKHNVQYSTYLNQRNKGDKVLDLVLNDFPSRAFNIYQSDYTIVLDSNRNAIVKIPFDFKWNPNYIIAVNEMLENVQDVSNLWTPHEGYVITILKKPGDIVGTQQRYRFNDLATIRRLNMAINNKEPMIKVKAVTKNQQVIREGCMSPSFFLSGRKGEEFYRINNNNTVLYGNIEVSRGTLLLTFSPDQNHLLSKISDVQLSVVSRDKCI